MYIDHYEETLDYNPRRMTTWKAKNTVLYLHALDRADVQGRRKIAYSLWSINYLGISNLMFEDCDFSSGVAGEIDWDVLTLHIIMFLVSRGSEGYTSRQLEWLDENGVELRRCIADEDYVIEYFDDESF